MKLWITCASYVQIQISYTQKPSKFYYFFIEPIVAFTHYSSCTRKRLRREVLLVGADLMRFIFVKSV